MNIVSLLVFDRASHLVVDPPNAVFVSRHEEQFLSFRYAEVSRLAVGVLFSVFQVIEFANLSHPQQVLYVYLVYDHLLDYRGEGHQCDDVLVVRVRFYETRVLAIEEPREQPTHPEGQR